MTSEHVCSYCLMLKAYVDSASGHIVAKFQQSLKRGLLLSLKPCSLAYLDQFHPSSSSPLISTSRTVRLEYHLNKVIHAHKGQESLHSEHMVHRNQTHFPGFHPDLMRLWKKIPIFLHDCEVKSRWRPGNEATQKPDSQVCYIHKKPISLPIQLKW